MSKKYNSTKCILFLCLLKSSKEDIQIKGTKISYKWCFSALLKMHFYMFGQRVYRKDSSYQARFTNRFRKRQIIYARTLNEVRSMDRKSMNFTDLVMKVMSHASHN